jgi:hypothetical protein
MIKELMKDGILGDAVARFHVLEFQKRGLPHVHLLIWLVPTDRPTDAESIDSIISAQLPNQKAEELYKQMCLTNVHKCDTLPERVRRLQQALPETSQNGDAPPHNHGRIRRLRAVPPRQQRHSNDEGRPRHR